MALLGGDVQRPTGSDSYWPPVGTWVHWRAHANIQRMFDSTKLSGGRVRCLGVLGGNAAHLTKHGGHTPWEPGKPRGVVHAIDLDSSAPAGKLQIGDWLIQLCRSNVDTSMIQFMNWRGDQFDFGGNRTGPSGDEHLHLHLRAGREAEVFDIVAQYNAYLNPTTPPQETDVPLNEDSVRVPATASRLTPGEQTPKADLALGHLIRRLDQDAIATTAKLDALVAAAGAEVERDTAERIGDQFLLDQVVTIREIVGHIQAGNPAELAELLRQVLGDDLGARLTAELAALIPNVRLVVDDSE